MSKLVYTNGETVIGEFPDMPNVDEKMMFVAKHHYNPANNVCAVIVEHDTALFWHATVVNLETEDVVQFVIVVGDCGCDDEGK